MTGVTDPYRWIPALVLAAVSVAGILRVVIRYDRFFVKDAGDELKLLRADMAELRRDLSRCTEQHAYAERQIAALTIEVAALRRQVEE